MLPLPFICTVMRLYDTPAWSCPVCGPSVPAGEADGGYKCACGLFLDLPERDAILLRHLNGKVWCKNHGDVGRASVEREFNLRCPECDQALEFRPILRQDH